MPEHPSRRITSRVVRPGQLEAPDRDWEAMTIEQRIEAVWELTLLCHGWTEGEPGAPRLQRSVVHVRRVRSGVSKRRQ